MKLVLITGAKGFIGRNLSRYLSNNNYKVGGIGHGSWVKDEYSNWGLKYWLNGNVTQSNLYRFSEEFGIPDTIFHLAGGSSVGLSLKSPEEDFRRTVDSTFQVLEWARKNAPDAGILLTSSAAVYGDVHDKPIRETSNPKPFSPYGYHKRISELLLESFYINYDLSITIVRLFSIYGAGLKKQLLWDLCNKFSDKPNLIQLSGTGTEKRDWLHVDDASRLLSIAKDQPVDMGFIINGGSGVPVTIKDIAECMREAWELDSRIEFSGKTRLGDPAYLVANTNILKTIGFKPIKSWKNGIKEYVHWFRSRNGG